MLVSFAAMDYENPLIALPFKDIHSLSVRFEHSQRLTIVHCNKNGKNTQK